MSKGFVTYSDDESAITMLKDEPADLTHIAPVAGDVCIPLDENFLPNMLDDILLRDNFESLLTEDTSDPFNAYRDFTDTSPHLLTPNATQNSECSLHALCDSHIDNDQTSSFMNFQIEEDIELLKTPYISMNITNDLPLLVSNDLMWSSREKKNHHENSSSLAKLLSKSLHKHQLKQNEYEAGLESKSSRKSWNEENNFSLKSSHINKLDRTQSTKRSNCVINDYASKKSRSNSKDKMATELLQQLISNNNNKHQHREKTDWFLEQGSQKAACISQTSDSVLMNLLVSGFDIRAGYICLAPKKSK